jgi:hypothetical protein
MEAAEKKMAKRVWTSKRAYPTTIRYEEKGSTAHTCGQQISCGREKSSLEDTKQCSCDDETIVSLNDTLQRHDLRYVN